VTWLTLGSAAWPGIGIGVAVTSERFSDVLPDVFLKSACDDFWTAFASATRAFVVAEGRLRGAKKM
jgi:hypothetical protein